jgi:hypothetical protein
MANRINRKDLNAAPIQNVDASYADLTAMFADQATQEKGYLQKITGDEKLYLYLGTTVGDITDYHVVGGANVQSDWAAVDGDALILNKPSIPANTSDLTNDSGFITGIGVSSDNANPQLHQIATVEGTIVNETLTQLNTPTLTGNILTLAFLNENNVEQTVTVDLSSINQTSSGISNASYNAATNIITLTEDDATEHTIDLSEFSIISATDGGGVTTLTQEGVVKLTVSKVGQSGLFADLLSKPTTISGYGITDAELTLGNPTNDGYILSSTAAGTRSWILDERVVSGSVTGTKDKTLTLNQNGGGTIDIPFTDIYGMEIIDEGNGPGYRLAGRNAANYGNINFDAVDFSGSDTASTTLGATGIGSVAFGYENTASGFGAVVFGEYSTASGTNAFMNAQSGTASGFMSVAFGTQVNASGDFAIAGGNDVDAGGYSDLVWGTYNTTTRNDRGYRLMVGLRNSSTDGMANVTLGAGHINNAHGATVVGQAALATSGAGNAATSPVFVVGNGQFDYNSGVLNTISRSNALTVLLNGTVTAPSLTNTLIDTAGAKALITKEYLDLSIVNNGGQTNVQSDWLATSGDAFIKNKPAIPANTSDLTNDSGFITGITVSSDNANPTLHQIATVEGTVVNETLTQLNTPTLTGNILTLAFLNENNVEQTVTVDLSSINQTSSGISNASYNASTNIITLTEDDATEHTIDLSEFSIISATDGSGITTLTQETVVKLTVSKVGQSGLFADLLSTPTTISGYGITDAYTKTESGTLYVDFTSDQSISGQKTFTHTGGVITTKLNGAEIGRSTLGTNLYFGPSINAETNTKYNSVLLGGSAGTAASGGYLVGVGDRALEENTGGYAIGIGFAASGRNTGDDAIGIGQLAGERNTGLEAISIGAYTGNQNTADYLIAMGSTALYYNSGSHAIGFGERTGMNNTGSHVILMGRKAGENNKGDDSILLGRFSGQFNTAGALVGIGQNSGYYNKGINNTAIGDNAYSTFVLDTANAKTANDSTDIDMATGNITITAHGFGNATDEIELWYTTSGTSIQWLEVDAVNKFTVIDANTIQHEYGYFDSKGSGTHTFTPQLIVTNTTSIGANSAPTKSNQVMLGDVNVSEVYSSGQFISDTTIAEIDAEPTGKVLVTKEYLAAQPVGDTNVQSDWDAVSGDALILNKPTTVAGYGITDTYTKTESDTIFEEDLSNPATDGYILSSTAAGARTWVDPNAIGPNVVREGLTFVWDSATDDNNFTVTDSSEVTDVYLQGKRLTKTQEWTVVDGTTINIANVIAHGEVIEIVSLGTSGIVSIPTEKVNIVPTGTVDGANTTFTLPTAYEPGKIKLYLDGIRQYPGDDYTETTATTIDFTVAPTGGQKVILDYYQQ